MKSFWLMVSETNAEAENTLYKSVVEMQFFSCPVWSSLCLGVFSILRFDWLVPTVFIGYIVNSFLKSHQLYEFYLQVVHNADIFVSTFRRAKNNELTERRKILKKSFLIFITVGNSISMQVPWLAFNYSMAETLSLINNKICSCN